MELNVRPTTEADLSAINAIYNHYVAHSTCTYQLEPSTSQERQQWFKEHTHHKLPMTVAEQAGQVVGWASLSYFHPRPAYRFTVENSIYVHPNFLRKGIGRILLADLLQRSDQNGYRAVIALISADQEGSVRLHANAGFLEVGKLRGVGFKFDRWLDVVYMQRGTGG